MIKIDELSNEVKQLIENTYLNQNKNQYKIEKNKLYNLLGDSLLSDLRGQPCYIAGGVISSLFCSREINDIDIYFKSEEAFINFVTSIWEEKSGWIVSKTDKATLVKVGKKGDFQLIHFKYFPKASDIFDTFDFTACMGAFDFETETFHFHPDFIQHNSQRILKFNSKTAFPIMSLLRVQKYKEKGYKISKPEFIRIILTCMNLKIDTYEELKEQMGGMYGVNYDKLFSDKSGELDLEETIDLISNLSLHEDYFKAPNDIGTEMGNLDEYIDSVTKRPVSYFVTSNGNMFRVNGNRIRSTSGKPKNGIEINKDEFLRDKKYYKFVQKDSDGRYSSFYDDSFEYKIGEKAVAKGKGSYYYGNPVLYFNYLDTVNKSSYKNQENAVLIEVTFEPDDFYDADEDTVELKACTMVREVPKDEYQKYLK